MFFKKKVFSTIEDLYQDMLNKKNDYYNHKIDKYIVDYSILDEGHIEIKSNIGRKRIVANTDENLKRLNKLIVRSKVDIARKIDAYEKEASTRLVVFTFSLIMIILSFASVVSSFFIGNYILFLVSLLLFGFISSINMVLGMNYYILNKEINSLKKSTHYHVITRRRKIEKIIPQEDLSITQMILK